VALLSVVAPPVVRTQHGASTTRQTITRHFVPADREHGRYQYVPVEIAADVAELAIDLRFNDAGGTSVIDLGLFQPGPLTIGTSAFRGYSGGATRHVTIGWKSATPGYLPGPIPAGRWHVLLGLYKIAPDGVDVEIDVVTTTKMSAIFTDYVDVSPPVLPAGPRWFSGGLHLHTVHSDGTIGPNALAAAARATGLDFIVITDHNNTTHTLEHADSALPLRIVGEEITTPAGHANAWGLRAGAWIDFSVKPDEPEAARIIGDLASATHAAGALFSINHPVGECGGCVWEHVIPDTLDAIEIWNGRVGPQDGAIAIWDRLLQAGRHVTAVGASDWHRGADPIDAAAVRVFAPTLTERDLLDAIRRGHVIVMRSAHEAPPNVSARCGDRRAMPGDTLTCDSNDTAAIEVAMPPAESGRVDLVWNGARIASKPLNGAVAFTLPQERGYARAHVYARDGATIAVTNPVYVERR
jgi:hypothetical protein